VKVDRTKTKKSTYTNFEIFRMREKNIPIEQLEHKDPIIAFAWEPKGTKFAIIHGEGPRPDVSFYNMEKTIVLLKTLEKKQANHLFWSPQGRFIVLAGLHPNGNLEFYDANELESMGMEEHFNATAVDWDPTGRYVTSVVSFWRHQLETGYNLYSFQGKLLKRVLRDKFYQLLWRPRPPSLLPSERQKYIKDNLKQYSKKLREQDETRKRAAKEEAKKKKEALKKEFEDLLKARQMEYEQQRNLRRQIGEESDNEEDFEYRDKWVEEVESVQEIVLAD